jgi:hypothetical protein
MFGVRDFAEFARSYLQHDSAHEVMAFTVNRDYLPAERSFEDLPVREFENVEETNLPSEFQDLRTVSANFKG